MKITSVLLVAMGLTTSAVFAQSGNAGDNYRQQTETQSNRDSSAQMNSAMPGTSGSSGESGYSRSEAGSRFNTAPEVSYGPQEKTQNGVTYLCGGIGKEEANYMKEQARKYDMMLTFATRQGNYLANVDVNIKDARGNPVLQTSCDAPVLLVDVPKSGSYHVRAETSGYSLNRTAHVAATHNRRRVALVAMVWPPQAGSFGASGATSSGGSNVGGRSSSSANDYRRSEDGNSPRSRIYQQDGGGTSR